MIRRTYKCDVCEHEFTHSHDRSDEPYPECPQCSDTVAWMPRSFGTKTNKSRAMDFTQKMAEETFGLSNMRDNQRPGDIAAMGPPPMQTAEREAISQQMVEAGFAPLTKEQGNLADSFWQTSAQQTGHADPMIANAVQMAVAGAPAAAAAARKEGMDPIALLNAPGRPGLKLDVVSKVKAT